MARSALATVLSLGLSACVVVFSFPGCYADLRSDKGSCQVSNMPVDECMIPKCNADGTPAPVPVPDEDKQVCFRGANEGVCVKGACALNCETQMTPCKCDSDAACPTDKQCVDWSCTMGECKSALAPDDMLVDTLNENDCKKSVCKSGTPQVVADDTDIPNDMPADCKKPACSGDTPTQVPDTTDFPPPTGCTSYTCSDQGDVQPANSPVGTACATGACDANGMCVDCLVKAQFDTCKMTNAPNKCPVPKCLGEPCTMDVDCKTACADGVCCNTSCTDECKSCNVDKAVGTCTNIPYYEEDSSYTDPVFMTPATCLVATGSVCNGMGDCRKFVGKTCLVDADCISNKCAPAKVCLGAKGEGCSSGPQCVSGSCNAMGTCD